MTDPTHESVPPASNRRGQARIYLGCLSALVVAGAIAFAVYAAVVFIGRPADDPTVEPPAAVEGSID
jgi:hypothetical protein